MLPPPRPIRDFPGQIKTTEICDPMGLLTPVYLLCTHELEVYQKTGPRVVSPLSAEHETFDLGALNSSHHIGRRDYLKIKIFFLKERERNIPQV